MSNKRKLVPCECPTCGGTAMVQQQVRRRHIEQQLRIDQERLIRSVAAAAAAQRIQATPPLPRPSSSDVTANRSTVPGALHPSPPAISHENASFAPPLSPPPSLPSDTTDFAHAQSAPLVSGPSQDADPPGDLEDDQPLASPNLTPIMDDNWEEPDEEIDETIVPAALADLGAVQNHAAPAGPAPAHLEPPEAAWIPEAKLEENSPDPFLHLSASVPPSPPPKPHEVHPQTGIYLLYMLVSWLHLQYHLPFRACAVLMQTVLLIARSFGAVIEDPAPLVTLPSVFSRLDVEPTLSVLPVCPSCKEVYPSGLSTPFLCPRCTTPMFKSSSHGKRVPLLQTPHMSLQAQLAAILTIPGVEAMLDEWRFKPRIPGRYTDIFDGAVAKELKAHDGSLFFANGLEDGPDGELRIGVTLGLDWFSYIRSQIAPGHSSAPISFSIANLPSRFRYRTSNLILTNILPGPKEQSPDQVQRFLRILVNELLRLWKDGFVCPTENHPTGRRVRVILMCVCCDKPAAHKVGGFGSHSHTYFCTRCWITQADKGTPAAFKQGGFAPRTDLKHREAGAQYTHLESEPAREAFVKANAARWTELARLPYFDIVRQIVIDPMHNLLLGLVKTHFYHIWVQNKILRKKHELAALHAFLKDFELPAFLGRLPALVGEPAGGSLTADQWMVLAIVVGPLAIPQIWEKFCSSPNTAMAQREAQIKRRMEKRKRDAESKKAKAAAKRKAAKEAEDAGQKTKEAPEAPVAEDEGDDVDVDPCLHPNDPANFLKLSLALRILLKRELNDMELNQAETLLEEYCTELISLYGSDMIRPNHHYCIHTPDCVRDFGPLHEFWTFLFERLNKVLKSYKTNNHNGGELEVTFFREFHRTLATSRLVARSVKNDTHPDQFIAQVAGHMFGASEDDRGTLQALARDLDSAKGDEGILFRMSPLSSKGKLGELYPDVLAFIQRAFPDARIRHLSDMNDARDRLALPDSAVFHDYVVMDGRRYSASSRSKTRKNSWVEVIVSQAGETCVGELTDIIQVSVGPTLSYAFGRFRWLREFNELGVDISSTIWESFSRSRGLGVRLWHDGPPRGRFSPQTFMPLQFIQSHVALNRVDVRGHRGIASITVKN